MTKKRKRKRERKLDFMRYFKRMKGAKEVPFRLNLCEEKNVL